MKLEKSLLLPMELAQNKNVPTALQSVGRISKPAFHQKAETDRQAKILGFTLTSLLETHSTIFDRKAIIFQSLGA